MKSTLLFLFFWAMATCTQAAEVLEISPITHRILMVQVRDGYVVHHKKGQPRSSEYVVQNALNVSLADQSANYFLSSTDDPAYSSARTPVSVSRKSKGQDFTWICQNWDNTLGCQNLNVADHTKDHWLYLFLPDSLVSDKSYTLDVSAVGIEGNSLTFVFDEKILHSEAIHVNNLGYSPAAPAKYGYLYHWMGNGGAADLSGWSGRAFRLVDSLSQQTVFSGKINFRKAKSNIETGQSTDSPGSNFLGSDVYECNFSAFNTPGTYRLVVDGIGSSFPFRIAADAYFEPFYWVMNGLYQQRSGIATVAPYTDQPRPAPHNPTLTPGFAEKLQYSSRRMQDLENMDNSVNDKAGIEAGFKGPIDTWGWYQDAGDWDGYFTHLKIPAELMFLYEMAPAQFTDGQLLLPEAGNGLPDLLDEARWLIRYLHRTRAAMKAAGYGTGGVGGARVAGDWFGGDERPDGTTHGSWEDTGRTWAVLGEDVFTTFRYAGLAAHFAYLLQTGNFVDPEGINWTEEAESAYEWAINHTQSNDYQAPHELNVWQDRMYAAVSLYRLTGNRTYHDQLILDIPTAKYANGSKVYTASASVNEGWSYPVYAYLLMPGNRPVDATSLQLMKDILVQSANGYIGSASQRGSRWAGDFYFPMLIGHSSTPMISRATMGYGIARRFAPATADTWKSALFTTADYFLGANPLNMTWISGVGERSPFDIFCIDSWYLDSAAFPRKGIVPYGPWRSDPTPRPLGPWDNDFAAKTLTPALNLWPGHERWWNSRTTPLQSEYTVHQNTLPAAITYGLLSLDLAQTPAWQPYDESYEFQEPVDPVKIETPRVAPNPAKGHSLRILWPDTWQKQNVTLELIDLAGREVIRFQLSEIKDPANEFPITLASGIYLLSLTTSIYQFSTKVVLIP